MGFLGDLSREYMRHRLHGGHHWRHPRSFWAPPRGHWGAPGGHWGHWTTTRPSHHWMARHRGGPFGGHRRRSNVQVRGCGCCLPIPLALVTGAGLGARSLLRSR